MRKLRTRILAGGAVAVFAGATAFAVTSTAGATTRTDTAALTTATAKTGTTLTATAAQSAIKAGQKDTISGTLLAGGNPAPGRVVGLFGYSDRVKRWRLLRVKLTGRTGAVTFTVQPYISRKYELVYHGNSTLSPATSSAATITVAPSGAKRSTALSISATPTSVASGHTTAITGALTADGRPLRHRMVSLYRYNTTTKKWIRVAVELTGSRGGVRFVRELSTTATFELMYSGSRLLDAAHSGPASVTVAG